MALNEDKIKDLFSSKLGSFEPEVPASVWSGIDQLLSQMPIPSTPDASSAQAASQSSDAAAATKVEATLKTVLVSVGVAASVALGVFLAYNLAEEDESQVAEKIEPKEITEELNEEFLLDETTKVLAQADFVKPRTLAKSEDAESKELVVETAATLTEETEQEVAEEKLEVLEIEKEQAEEVIPLVVKDFFKKDISFGLRTNVGALASDMDNRGGEVLFSHNDRYPEFISMIKGENEKYKLSHKQPIAVGLTVSKNLSPRFSIETGLMFTYLSSNIKSNSSVNIKEEQVFGYLGIPIYLNYNFFELQKAKFYISLGAMMQKDIYGKYTSRLIGVPPEMMYIEPSYLRKNISQSNWQFSSHLNVGVAYPIYRKLYIRTSIGGAYYFDAGNEYRTIYSDKKFQLDLNLGLRFDF